MVKRVNLPRMAPGKHWRLQPPGRRRAPLDASLLKLFSASGVRLAVFRVMRPRSK